MNMSFGKALDAYLDHFPFCNSSQDETCYLNLMRDIQASIIKKPCIKLQYSGKAQSFSSGKNRQNIIEFKYRLDDFKSVTVHEEYLIFDSVAMIGSIGGTLGLCIGFSFANVFAMILKLSNIPCKKHSDEVINDKNILKSEKGFATKQEIASMQKSLKVVMEKLDQYQQKLDIQ